MKSLWLWWQVLWLALAFAGEAQALDPHKRISQYVHTHWTVDNGLPSNGVTAVLQTRDGYLWIATTHGLARFDGVSFTLFDRRNTPAFRSGSLSTLVEGADGSLWVGTLGGIVQYRAGRFSSVSTRDGLADDRILTLAVAPDGSLWAGGFGGLTQLRDGKVVRHFGVEDGLAGDPVTAIDVEANGDLWIASLAGLNGLRKGRIEAVPCLIDTPDLAFRDLFRLHDGTLLVRTLEGKLWRRTAQGFSRWSVPGVPSEVAVRFMLEDRHGNLWVGTEQHGLFRVRGNKVDRYGEAQGFTGGRVRTLAEDRDGNLWLGSFHAGLYRIRDGIFTTWGRPEGMGSDAVFTVLQDRTHSFWVGTNMGLVRLQGMHVQPVPTMQGLTGALYESRASDALWVGGTNGLSRLQGGRTTEVLTTRDGLPSGGVEAVLEDRMGKLWIGTNGGGVARRSSGGFTVYNRTNGLADDFINALHEDRAGTLWVGTANGVSLIREGRVVSDAQVPRVAGEVTYFHEDSDGTLWIGTDGNGLYRWRAGRLTAYANVSGFPDDTVYAILDDARGRFWFNSYRGVYSIERAQLDAVASGARSDVVAVRYGLADGLRSIEGNGGSQPAGWRSDDGRLWFPTMGGLSVVDPAKIRRSESAPPVNILSLRADEQPVAIYAPIRLPADTRRLDIQYTAPTLSVPERTRFRIALDGFDSRWVEAGDGRVAHFTNLEPGKYSFRVAAGSATGGWNPLPTRLEFSVAARFYQTWWFKLLVGLAAIAVVGILHYLRMAWIATQNAVLRERQRIAGEIHDDLAQSLAGIFYQTEAARRRLGRDPEAAARHLEAASELASRSADAARHSVLELVTLRIEPGGLRHAIEAAARVLTQGREIALDVQDNGLVWNVPPHIAHHLLRIAQATVANAVEHGHCHAISIRLFYARKSLTLLVRDDGCGFNAAEAIKIDAAKTSERGFGLGNVRRRAHSIGGRLDVQCAPGLGTSVRVTIKRRQRIWQVQRSLGAAFGRPATSATTTQDPNSAG
ncbi:MAG: two-component regulator propeller domain-containing protein [Lysobacterales bacterium]